MKLNPPTTKLFWTAIIIAAVGVVLEIVLLIAKTVPYLSLASFVVILLAFVLICLGLTKKGL